MDKDKPIYKDEAAQGLGHLLDSASRRVEQAEREVDKIVVSIETIDPSQQIEDIFPDDAAILEAKLEGDMKAARDYLEKLQKLKDERFGKSRSAGPNLRLNPPPSGPKGGKGNSPRP
jgi:hypothetical protein